MSSTEELLKRAEDMASTFCNGLPYVDPNSEDAQMSQIQVDEPDEMGNIRLWVADDCTVGEVHNIEGTPHDEMAQAICGAGKLLKELTAEIRRLQTGKP